jgi:GMP synthase-like glutamine amidotransferase
MNLDVLQHAPFEGPGAIEPWAREHGHRIRTTRLFAGEQVPRCEDVEWLVALGGPMSVHDESEFPWLATEKSLLRELVGAGRRVLGICLGAQLLAAALGARVYRSARREIGWFPVRRRPEAGASALGRAFPTELEAFHWHGESFDLPEGAVPLASSNACPNQGFVFGDCVLALQFHLETTPESVALLAAHCPEDLAEGPFVQTRETMMSAGEARFRALHSALAAVLEALSESGRRPRVPGTTL